MAKRGDVTTAWTISLYVVTAAAGKFKYFEELEGIRLTEIAVIALLAIIGSLKDV